MSRLFYSNIHSAFFLYIWKGSLKYLVSKITDEIYVVWNTIPHFDLLTKDFLQENDNDFLSWKHHSWKCIFLFSVLQVSDRNWELIPAIPGSVAWQKIIILPA